MRTYGLRASLFYHLFGRLQVYDTNVNMRAAQRELGQQHFTAIVSYASLRSFEVTSLTHFLSFRLGNFCAGLVAKLLWAK